MSVTTRMTILKGDLQMITISNDAYLNNLLSYAEQAVSDTGITLKDDVEDDNLVAMYAAWLFRKRAESDNGMPRMLDIALKKRLLKEKMGGIGNVGSNI